MLISSIIWCDVGFRPKNASEGSPAIAQPAVDECSVALADGNRNRR
jgi:hypothetical protein